MKKCKECIIGLHTEFGEYENINEKEYNELVTKLFNKFKVDRFAESFFHGKIYTFEDFEKDEDEDIPVSKYSYCPRCGKEIKWKQIKDKIGGKIK